MSILPLRSRALATDSALHVADDGRFFASGAGFVDRLRSSQLEAPESDWLRGNGFAAADDDALGAASFAYRVAQRLTLASDLDYLILVPTLRCNLSCSYCQVSRAPAAASGFDWSEETVANVLGLIDGLATPRIKIEFQGGEPTLRPDLIEQVMDRCGRFETAQFVICTNLQEVGEAQLRLFDRTDTFISTSLDGDFGTHERQRTGAGTSRFETNLRRVIDRYGPEKVSALPTIDPGNPPHIDSVINTFAGLGLTSIFLRPINFQGFARKRHGESRDLHQAWGLYHRQFVERLIELNWSDRTQVLEETYFSICLRRIFHPHAERHVDLRNPNPMGVDYLVIDHDGQIYPTDEARMLSRSGVIDLGLGHVGEDWRGETWRTLNSHATNQFDDACSRCAYQPFCGRDLVDDLARYGRIDVPRTETAFCQRHLGLFDFIFELIYDADPRVQYSLARWLRLDGETPPLGDRLS